MHKFYIKHIDGLRALAVILVFLCHLDLSIFPGGFIGVDVFFVISGFLITNNIIKQLESSQGFSFIDFYERRVRRILPALFFTLFISFLASTYLLNTGAFRVFGKSLIYAALSISNIFFSNNVGYFDIFAKTNPLLHTWSLGVEEQFYLLYPILLFITYQRTQKNLSILFIILFLLSFLLNLYYQSSEATAIYYLTQYRIFEFCIGSFLVNIRHYQIKPLMQELTCCTGTICIIISALNYNANTIFPSYNALLPCLGAALIILTGHAKYFGSIFRAKPAQFTGLISYSLYLVHWPLITFVKTYNEDCGLEFNINTNEKIAIIITAFFIATFMYYCIEQPFRYPKKSSTTTANSSHLSYRLITIMRSLGVTVCFISLGLLISKSHGWLWRVAATETIKNVKDVSFYHQQMWGGADFNGEFIYKGATSYPKIVIMGDSHTGMLDEGMVKEIGEPMNLTIFTASGGGAGKYYSSLLIPGITRLDKEQKAYDDSAKNAYKEAIALIHQTANPSVLILSSAWASQLGAAGDLKHHHSFKIDPSKMPSYQDYTPLWQGIDKLLNLLKNKKLIIIGDVPGTRFNPVQCLGGVKWIKRPHCKKYDPYTQNIAAININKVFAEYAAKKENVYFINPYDYLCIKDKCKNLDNNGEPLYSDGSHLSKVGSRFLVDSIKNRILTALDD